MARAWHEYGTSCRKRSKIFSRTISPTKKRTGCSVSCSLLRGAGEEERRGGEERRRGEERRGGEEERRRKIVKVRMTK